MGPTLALLVRSLTVDVRRWQTYIMRALLLAIVLFMLAQYHIMSAMIGAPGLQLFTTIMFTNLVFLGLFSASYLASAVSEEKEDGMLGLLRMTRLNGIAILLGKGLSRLVGLMIVVLVQAPFTLLAVTLGGVAPRQILAAYIVLLTWLIFLAGLALFCSVVCAKNKSAGALMTVLGLAYLIGPILTFGISELLDNNYPTFAGVVDHASQYMMDRSPFTQMQEVLRSGFSGSPIGGQTLWCTGIGIGLFLLAWLLFDRFSREQKEVTPGRGLLSRYKKSRFRNPGSVWSNSLMWKDFNFMAGGRPMIVVKLILYPIIIAGIGALFIYAEGRITDDFWWDVMRPIAITVTTGGLAIELLYGASEIFNVEMRWGTLPNLGVLPIPMRRVAFDKVRGFLMGVLPVFCYCLMLVPAWAMEIDDFEWLYFAFMASGQAMLVLHMLAYFSIRMKYGAFAVTFVAWWFGAAIVTSIFGSMSYFWGILDSFFMVAMIVGGIGFVLAWILQKLIVRRLQNLAV